MNTRLASLAVHFFPFAKIGMRFRASIIIAAITLAAAGPAGAQFPNCIKSVDNEELNPNADGTYPPDPAVPYPGTHTTWSTDGVVINLKIGDQEPSQFYIRGINYEPTQIGGGAGLPPFNDFFYTNSVETFVPLWSDNGRKDIGAMRAMGVTRSALTASGSGRWPSPTVRLLPITADLSRTV